MFVDATFKASKDSDYVAIGVWARVKSQPYLVDITNARLTFSETLAEILRLKQTWPQIRMVGIEDKANGSAIIDVLSASVPGVVPLTPRGSKHARASACTPMLRGLPGVVFPQHHPEIGALVDQAANFPAGSHDDLVDMLSYALDYYATLSSRGSFLERMRGVELD
jgi:predicted phage terminase large subunit-like protein